MVTILQKGTSYSAFRESRSQWGGNISAGIAREASVTRNILPGLGKEVTNVPTLGNEFIKSATEFTGSQGLTNVGRALQKYIGREGPPFQSINFSHKTANQQGLQTLQNIMNSKNQIIQQAKNGGFYIFDKSTGMGFGVSRNGRFNGFRDLK
ncbi:MAG: hypothetical protein LBL90_01395 [Prevotellaceae bacterium]|nr:hypothetical protein [Prevotellaceae bacterium]